MIRSVHALGIVGAFFALWTPAGWWLLAWGPAPLAFALSFLGCLLLAIALSSLSKAHRRARRPIASGPPASPAAPA